MSDSMTKRSQRNEERYKEAKSVYRSKIKAAEDEYDAARKKIDAGKSP